jgi:hypothetical protein
VPLFMRDAAGVVSVAHGHAPTLPRVSVVGPRAGWSRMRPGARMTGPSTTSVAQAAAELRAIIAGERRAASGERRAEPFLHWRDDRGRQLLLALGGARWRVTIGRDRDCDVALTWDTKVSRSHALLERVAGSWTVVDDGLSRNGTFLNGARLVGRQRVANGDRVDVGGSSVFYHQPLPSESASTAMTNAGERSPSLSPMQRKVLLALCGPVSESSAATPATNRQIAAEVCLSVGAVKANLRVLCERFALSQLPQNEKRARLAQAALATGIVQRRDL